MSLPTRKLLCFMGTALVLFSAAIYAIAQDKPNKRVGAQQASELGTTAPSLSEAIKNNAGAVRYSYEFTQPDFIVRRILIEHDAAGRGQITFERKSDTASLTEKLEISPEALVRIMALWDALRFLESNTNYQSDKQFPHLGTYRTRITRGTQQRTAAANSTNDHNALALINEDRRLADQALFIFDINIARETDPLEAPKILERLNTLLSRGGLSDPHQLVPLLRDLTTDERVPLIARNQAGRMLKKIKK